VSPLQGDRSERRDDEDARGEKDAGQSSGPSFGSWADAKFLLREKPEFVVGAGNELLSSLSQRREEEPSANTVDRVFSFRGGAAQSRHGKSATH